MVQRVLWGPKVNSECGFIQSAGIHDTGLACGMRSEIGACAFLSRMTGVVGSAVWINCILYSVCLADDTR